MKQYLPLKPVKRGFKVWVVADSSNGYFLDVQVYVGKESAATEYGLGERVVLELTEQYRGKGYRVFCDNFFSSPALFKELLHHGIYACRTTRQNRHGLPNDIRTTTLAREESMYWQNGALLAVAWQDKRPVHVLSSLFQPHEMETVSRREREGSLISVSCPTAILTYTKYMGGVDLGDQLRKYYSVCLKCNKNYKYIFWFICITNSFILTKFCTAPTSSVDSRLKQFRERLAWSLIGDYRSRQRAGRRRSSAIVQPAPVTTPFHTPRHHPQQRCVYCHHCRNPPQRRESVWQCPLCEGAPTPCLTGREDRTDCWSLWHTQP